MKLKYLMGVVAGLFMAATSCAGNTSINTSENGETTQNDSTTTLVAYFSATGTTREAAAALAEVMNATLYEITPNELYTAADLDWRDTVSRSYVEMHNRTIRPAIADTLQNLDSYDVIFIGYPNWWNTAPTIINTFIESHNLSGKKVIPFMTSGGNDITNSEKDLHEAYPSLDWKEGKLLNDVTREDLEAWKASLGL